MALLLECPRDGILTTSKVACPRQSTDDGEKYPLNVTEISTLTLGHQFDPHGLRTYQQARSRNIQTPSRNSSPSVPLTLQGAILSLVGCLTTFQAFCPHHKSAAFLSVTTKMSQTLAAKHSPGWRNSLWRGRTDPR